MPEAAISLLLLAVWMDQHNGSTKTSREKGREMEWCAAGWKGDFSLGDTTEEPFSLSVNEIFIKMILCVLAG